MISMAHIDAHTHTRFGQEIYELVLKSAIIIVSVCICRESMFAVDDLLQLNSRVAVVAGLHRLLLAAHTHKPRKVYVS